MLFFTLPPPPPQYWLHHTFPQYWSHFLLLLSTGYFIILLLSTGCILGGSALGSPRSSGEAVGKKAAEELLEAVETGGTVDKYIQVR